jgi:hypothetical protein
VDLDIEILFFKECILMMETHNSFWNCVKSFIDKIKKQRGQCLREEFHMFNPMLEGLWRDAALDQACKLSENLIINIIQGV